MLTEVRLERPRREWWAVEEVFRNGICALWPVGESGSQSSGGARTST